MFSFGLVVALGLLVSLAKLPWRQKLWVTSHALVMDVAVFVLLCFLHWGTFSGVMVATVGALFCSITITLCRRIIGYIEKGKYVRGFMDVSDRI